MRQGQTKTPTPPSRALPAAPPGGCDALAHGVTVLSFLPHSAKMRLATWGLCTLQLMLSYSLSRLMAWRLARSSTQRLIAYASVIGYAA